MDVKKDSWNITKMYFDIMSSSVVHFDLLKYSVIRKKQTNEYNIHNKFVTQKEKYLYIKKYPTKTTGNINDDFSTAESIPT